MKLTPQSEGSFQFISIQNPAEAKDRDKRRLARSHAVKQALQSSRKPRPEPSRTDAGPSGQTLSPWSVLVSPSASGPFETLFGDSPRLRALLSHGKFSSGPCQCHGNSSYGSELTPGNLARRCC